ncbi:ribosomal protein subunit L32 [Schizosaccharomyces japonicus yFS275]|uniref:Large ribosomal subunit protein bL32m n=1 Tax=Schizosaccharomyces japonicus (strain yFS275 / FY16936) TaxID=402676 RepID=B6JWR7_SCHJY|nr:ribosomal protein subunit L32 [Schizosaccharomyces japonicus yFS275]EEB05818.1 ribosomal protein subunit L32 [Schizosaccharomyces japonicus yFS275]
MSSIARLSSGSLFKNLSSKLSFLQLPSIRILLPKFLTDLHWIDHDSILLAAPKKRKSYSRKRMRQLAGKALVNKTNINRCPICGGYKLAHNLCPMCYKNLRKEWRNSCDVINK